ncbi:hypothetical protein Tco_0424120 [Tanacetum coccineum]
MTSICDMVGQYMQKKEEEKRIAEEQAAKDRYWKIPICYDDDEDYTIAITPISSTKEPVNSLIMGDEHLDTFPATESDEVIKSSVENLVPIPRESEGIPDNNPTLSSDVMTKSPSTSLNLFLEETNTFDNSSPESETFCFDLEDNCSGSTTTRSGYSLPDYEAFYSDDDHIKEKSSGNEIIRDVKEKGVGSSFYNESKIDRDLSTERALKASVGDDQEDSPPLELVLLSVCSFPPVFFPLCEVKDLSLHHSRNLANLRGQLHKPLGPHQLSKSALTIRSDFYHEELADELAHIISPPEYDHFCFKIKPELGNLTMDVVEDILPTREPRVHVPNVLPTHPTLHLDMDFILLRLSWIFEASRARGFVLRSQELHILSFIWEIRYPNLID